MADQNATLKYSIQGCPSPNQRDIDPIPYYEHTNGVITVPALAAIGTTYSVDFGTIGTEALYAEIRNGLSYDIYLIINGATMNYRLPPGGIFIHAQPVEGTSATGKLLSLTVKLTAEQVEEQYVTYRIMGDPTGIPANQGLQGDKGDKGDKGDTGSFTAQTTVGETTGMTAGAGTAVDDAATFTGNSGTKAYTINDIVKHLKTVGILARS